MPPEFLGCYNFIIKIAYGREETTNEEDHCYCTGCYTLKKSGPVQICAVKGDWALVQTLGERGLYAFVKIDKLKNITRF